MAGPAFLATFFVMLILPIVLIGRLKLNKEQKIGYVLWAVFLPIAIFITVRMAVTLGLIEQKLTEQSALESSLLKLVVWGLYLGPWIVLVFAARKQKHNNVQSSESD